MVEWHEYREVEQSIIYPKSIQRCILPFQSMPDVSAIALLSCGVHGASDVICPSLAAGDDIIATPALRNLSALWDNLFFKGRKRTRFSP